MGWPDALRFRGLPGDSGTGCGVADEAAAPDGSPTGAKVVEGDDEDGLVLRLDAGVFLQVFGA
jgi:hypothetical protein